MEFFRSMPSVVRGLVVGHVAVFGAWQTLGASRDGQALMTRHFTCNMHNLRAGRVHTLLTSTISHEGFTHMALGTVGLMFIAAPIARSLGTARFLRLYFGAGVVSCGTHIAVQRLNSRARIDELRNQAFRNGNLLAVQQLAFAPKYIDRPVLGASGALMSMLAFFATTSPRTPMQFMFIPVPIPAAVLVGGLVAWDLYSVVSKDNDGISHGGHLGGASVGFLYALALRRRSAMFRNYYR